MDERKRTNERTNERLDGWMDVRTNERTDGRMNKRTLSKLATSQYYLFTTHRIVDYLTSSKRLRRQDATRARATANEKTGSKLPATRGWHAKKNLPTS